jgi:hypothetical protein
MEVVLEFLPALKLIASGPYCLACCILYKTFCAVTSHGEGLLPCCFSCYRASIEIHEIGGSQSSKHGTVEGNAALVKGDDW